MNQFQPRTTTVAPTPAAIAQRIKAEDDFGHELRVGAILRRMVDGRIEHGGTYTDQLQGKPRQFDFRVRQRRDSQVLRLAVECKNLDPAAPLIVCGRERTPPEAYYELIKSATLEVKNGPATTLARDSETLRTDYGFLYPRGKFVGKSLVRWKNDGKLGGDSDVYDRWAQALSSGVGLAEDAARPDAETPAVDVYTVVLALLVVPDGSLWVAEYGDDGELLKPPAARDHVSFFLDRYVRLNGTQSFAFSHVDFLTLSGLTGLLRRVSDGFDWSELFSRSAVRRTDPRV